MLHSPNHINKYIYIIRQVYVPALTNLIYCPSGLCTLPLAYLAEGSVCVCYCKPPCAMSLQWPNWVKSWYQLALGFHTSPAPCLNVHQGYM